MARAAERRALTSASFLPWALHCTILVHFYYIAQFLYSSCTLLVQLKERGNLFVLVAPPEPISPKLFSRTPWPSKPWCCKDVVVGYHCCLRSSLFVDRI